MNNKYVSDYTTWRLGSMQPNGKDFVRKAIRDGFDPEPLVLKYYQENVNPLPKVNIQQCPGYEGYTPANLSHEVCKHCGSIEYYH